MPDLTREQAVELADRVFQEHYPSITIKSSVTHSHWVVDAIQAAHKQGQEARDAAAPVARPLVWDQDSSAQWTDQHHGFSIMEEPGDELPFCAAWGEGDSEQFATLEQAKAWCQEQIDGWVARHVMVENAAPPRPLVPLTDTKIIEIWGDGSDGPSTRAILAFVRAIERHHGITQGSKT